MVLEETFGVATDVLKTPTRKCFTTDFHIYRRDGKVTWLDLQDGLRKVAESARSDVSYKEREMPEWLVANRKVPFQYLVCSILTPWSLSGGNNFTEHPP